VLRRSGPWNRLAVGTFGHLVRGMARGRCYPGNRPLTTRFEEATNSGTCCCHADVASGNSALETRANALRGAPPPGVRSVAGPLRSDLETYARRAEVGRPVRM